MLDPAELQLRHSGHSRLLRHCQETLYDPNLTKIVFILHSQGAIEGGMIIDWLLQEVPQDLLSSSKSTLSETQQTISTTPTSTSSPNTPQ